MKTAKRNTKVVATVSDRRCSPEFLQALIEAGADVIRLNTAHQEPADTLRVIENIRQVSDKVAILLDTKGPEVRTTKAPEDIEVKTGDTIELKGAPDEPTTREAICVNYEDFAVDVPVGATILIDDGHLELKVIEGQGVSLICKVMNDGVVKGRKSVNTPNIHLNLPSLNHKDRRYLAFAAENDIDFIAHSFVRNKEDVLAIKAGLDFHGSKAKIIAKIENQEGVDNIDEILDNCYGVMVARGDLGIEIEAAKIPAIQKRLVRICREKRRPVIVATQMLQSMEVNPRATRAEVSDVANAVYDGTDAVMLSGETAHGKFPIEAVKTMASIAEEAEKERDLADNVTPSGFGQDTTVFLAQTAIRASTELPVKAVLADTTTGRSARFLSAYRGPTPVYTRCYCRRVMRQLALSYGIHTAYMEKQPYTYQFLRKAISELLTDQTIKEDDLIVVLAGNFGPNHGASFVEVATPKRILAENRGAPKPDCPAVDGNGKLKDISTKVPIPAAPSHQDHRELHA